MQYENLKKEFSHIHLKFNEPLAKYSYTRTGGPADVIAFPKTIDEVKELVNWVHREQVPLTILGNLSNLIVRDGGIPGLVMILTDLNHIEITDKTITAESGATLIDVTRRARDHHLTGLEFACGIPGSVGGAVFMNAGAYGGEIKDLPLEILALTRSGNLVTYKNETCDFHYRYSVFQKNADIILQATLQLEHGQLESIQSEMDRVTQLRESKQPLEYPSCGSVFKRPDGYFTGQLIQNAGLQGYRIGGAEISRKHAGFIVNVDRATATDYINMIQFIQETIWRINQVQLEPEVRIIGREN